MKNTKINIALGLVFSVGLILPAVTSAATFNQNNLINDVVFDNTATMSPSGIDTFLNTFPNSCISPNNGFQAVDPIGYDPTHGYSYGGNATAGQVIYDASQAYNINPQVLLSTLQKEQTLVTGAAGCSTLRYTGAMGYGCPDGGTTYNYSGLNLYTINGNTITSVNGTCVNTASKAGFSQQVIRAAWLLKFGEQRSEGNVGWAIIKGNWNNSDDPQSCYGGPMTQGTFARCPSGGSSYYDGYTTIDGTSVHMDNGSTAALYWYTPHISGNQSFFNIFSGWFGSPYVSNVAYEDTIASVGAYTDSGRTNPYQYSDNTIALAPGQTAYLRIRARNFGYKTWDQSYVHLGTTSPLDRQSAFADSSWLAPNRISMSESSVLPGDIGTFEFSITAPQTPGAYYEHLNLVADGISWMQNPDFYLPIDVTAPQQPFNTTVTSNLQAGEYITPDTYMLSGDAQSALRLQRDGNIVLTNDYKVTWSSGTHSLNISKLVVQSDGNLVLYSTDGAPLWASNTGGANAHLALQKDGNLVLYDGSGNPLWSSGTGVNPPYTNRVVHTITPVSLLLEGQRMTMPDNKYSLVLQHDGNLVLYNLNGKALWSSNTKGVGLTLTLQKDGNLVLYNPDGKPLWSTATSGNNVRLALQNDGNLVLYSSGGMALWSSDTLQIPSSSSVLGTNATLSVGQSIKSPNGYYNLVLQYDGNLVLYDSAGRPLWSTGTSASGITLANQNDGNLVLYDSAGRPLWSLHNTIRGTFLALQNDGNLVFYDSTGKPIWSTGT